MSCPKFPLIKYCAQSIPLCPSPYFINDEIISENNRDCAEVLHIIIILEIKVGAAQRVRKFKKVQAKKLAKSNKSTKKFREIAFLVVLNFFPVQKFIFGHF